MRPISQLLLCCGLLVLSGCTPLTGKPIPTPTVKPYPALGQPVVAEHPIPTSTSSVPALTVAQLRNAQYTTYLWGPGGQTYQLTEGAYIQNGDPASPDYASIVLLEPIAFGDLNQDGALDAAILLSENHGGSGIFVSLTAVLNQGGLPAQAAITAVDDRPIISSLYIEDNKLMLEATIHGFDDPGCCPNFPVSRTYTLNGNQLILTRQTSRTPNGQERIINITAPIANTRVDGTIQVQGDVSIAPFENNLVCRLYDQTDQLLYEGPITVRSADLGAPGTFDTTFPLVAGSVNARIRIEVLDISMADGATLAMDSVEVIGK